ncbi:hypothetical protein BSM4216_1868 [Bacillus smithii]|jgi:uncharacterized protein (UPF0335 family)|nr:hypothetical protein BSM4216_1868 [Bacillus smithii]
MDQDKAIRLQRILEEALNPVIERMEKLEKKVESVQFKQEEILKYLKVK